MIRMMLLVSAFILVAGQSYATPPQAMVVNYDPKKENLTVTITHTSYNLKKHYIRKLVVYKNNETPEEYFYKRQPSPDHFSYDISLKAKPKDVIKVKAFCVEGGSKEVMLTVPEVDQEKK